MAQSWRQVLRESAEDFVAWMDLHDRPERSLAALATDLERFLTTTIQTAGDAISFWHAIPDVRAACNQPETYEKPFAAEAYAYVHLLDRYWRTWEVLLELAQLGALPLGKDGVRVLDIGTGPGPTPYAFQDFYELLREFGRETGRDLFTKQDLTITVVERSPAMQRFLHNFSESSMRRGPFGADRKDFGTLDPVAERQELEWSLRSEQWYEPESDDYFYEYTPAEANWIAQRHHRYRSVVFSNFFTVGEVVDQFTEHIQRLLSDLRYGGTVVVLGAKGNHYQSIYNSLTRLAELAGMRELPGVPATLGTVSYFRVARIVKGAQHNVYRHLVALCGEDALPRAAQFPDYWEPEPCEGKRTEFALRVFRKGRWPVRVPRGNVA